MERPSVLSSGRRSSPAGNDLTVGSIELICGCMFSGKTTEMLLRILRERPGSALVIKHIRDTRYGANRVVTHDRLAIEAVAVSQPDGIPGLVHDEHRLVAIDEGHFFDADLVETCLGLRSAGLRVLVTSLDLDSWGRPLRTVEALSRVADSLEKRRAVCRRCGQAATRTQRLTPVLDSRIVGGAESFEPRCPECWRRPPEEPVDI